MMWLRWSVGKSPSNAPCERGTEGVRAHHRDPGFTPGATQGHPKGCGTKTVSALPPFSKGGVLPGGLGDFASLVLTLLACLSFLVTPLLPCLLYTSDAADEN